MDTPGANPNPPEPAQTPAPEVIQTVPDRIIPERSGSGKVVLLVLLALVAVVLLGKRSDAFQKSSRSLPGISSHRKDNRLLPARPSFPSM